RKGSDGKWTPKAELAEFSMAITRASYDKATGVRRWRAVASDTDEDSYKDNMSMELFQDFLQRIETNELPPESFRSDFWSGGKPYISVSHYPDLNGKGVPGPVDTIYIDGNRLKSTGRFDDSTIGRACFNAVCRDLYDKENPVPDDKKVRISIAFLDWKHRHKSSGYVFERSEDDPICPECLKEMFTGKASGKEFLKGHLVHLALTRVPVNKRTSMEVERSMTTRKEDAESIIGEELAEELEDEAKLIGKSEALVIKSDDQETEESTECCDDELVEEAKSKKPCDEAEEDMEDEGEIPDEEAKKKKKKFVKEEEKKAEVVEDNAILVALAEIKSAVVKEPVAPHPLDETISKLKETFNWVIESNMEDKDAALRMIQDPLEQLGNAIRDSIVKPEVAQSEVPEVHDAMAEVVAELRQELGLLRAEIVSLKQPVKPVTEVPVRRSISPALVRKLEPQEQKKSSLSQIVRRSVGLES
ncbi:MAG TPA: hypothetical protein VF893_01120, partial [Candidatus Bathyarchaeia archaeon]